MKNLKTLIAFFSLLSLGATAEAVLLPRDMTYFDTDMIGDKGILNAQNTSVQGVWDIVNDDFDSADFNDGERDRWGFDNRYESVTDVALAFIFYEVSLNGDLNVGRVRFNIAGLLALGSAPIVQTQTAILDNSYFGGSVYANLLAQVEDDGKLAWEVTLVDPSGSSSTILYAAAMGVNVIPKRVPDAGTTSVFLGMGVLALLVVGRRFR